MATEDELRAARARGGSVSGGNFKNDHERASIEGVKGGKKSSGNFKNNPARAAEAGRIGGAKSRRGRSEAKE